MEDNKYSKFGNFLARGGGQPTPTPELLATATPEQLAFYDIQRKTARNKGLGEMLLLMGDAFGGRDISGRAAQRRTLLSQQQAKAKQQKLVEDWKLRNPDRAGDVDALMAGIPESFLTPKLTKSDYVVEILGKMKSNPDYVLTPTDQRILDTVANTDPLKIMVRDVQNQMSGGVTTPVPTVTPPNTPTTGPVTITSQAEYDALPVGTQFFENGTLYKKE